MDADQSFYTEFTPVKPRRKRRNNIQKDRQSPLALLQYAREDLGRDNWLKDCQRIVEESLSVVSLASPHVLCLGLGSPSISANARVQLGFLLEICDHLKINRANVSVYDPVFTPEDMSLFEELKIQLLAENKNGGYSIIRPTICFMPHCDIDMYENLLQANWSKQNLSNIVLVANRLADYLDSNPLHKLGSQVPCLLRIAPILDYRPLPTSKSWPTAFNNTAVQFVDDSRDRQTFIDDILK